MSEQFDALCMEFIYEKAQDCMDWHSISTTGWKQSSGDFMDLDTCVVNEVGTVDETMASPTMYVVTNPHYSKPVLDWDSIKWHETDGPRSLMVARKKLIATLSQL